MTKRHIFPGRKYPVEQMKISTHPDIYHHENSGREIL